MLISRNKQELENVANEIKDTAKVETAVIVADFSEADNIGKIVKKVKALNHEIGVLVNNVGMMGPCYNMVGDMDKKIVKVVSSPVQASASFCVAGVVDSEHAASHNVLPRLPPRHGEEGQGSHHQHQQRGGAGAGPLPGSVQRHPALHLSIHSGHCSRILRLWGRYTRSKFDDFAQLAFKVVNLSFSQVDPCQVDNATNKCLISSTSLLAPTPAVYVNSAVKTLGYNNRTCGYWSHSLMMTLLLNMTPTLFSSLVIWCCSKSQYKATIINNNNHVVSGKKTPPPPQTPKAQEQPKEQPKPAKPAPAAAVQEKK